MSAKSIADAGSLAKLENLRKDVLRTGAEIESRLGSQVSVFVDDVLKELEAHTCRIALVGQIKAGKSSLANALIRRPGLLPTDVNPSTAVVTKVFVGAPAEKRNTALFHFFNDTEWERLMRGGRFNAVSDGATERPFAEANQKLAELRNRAQTRLGSDYAKHLGRHHLFNAVTPALLEQYVSVGDDKASHGGEKQPLFSDITKAAEVFLDEYPFAYPTVIIDTPGTNDPFFVRDEITHAYLSGADVYLMVLTAHQPLSESDLALFRMLKGLQRDKIVAVLNRVDILETAAVNADELAASVRMALQREFPNTIIPVVPASALWANAAIEGMSGGKLPAFNEAAARHCERGGLLSPSEVAQWRAGDASAAGRIAAVLYTASGVPAVIGMVARMIGNAVTEEQLLPSTSTLSAVTENTAISLRFGSQMLDTSRTSFHLRSPSYQVIKSKTEGALMNIEVFLSYVDTILNNTDNNINQAIAEDFQNIEKYMFYTVNNFAEVNGDLLARIGASPSFLENFSRETLRLRSELAEDFANHFANLCRSFQAALRDAEADLRQTAKKILPNLDDVLHFGVPNNRIPPVSVISLSRVTAFDLDDFWHGTLLREGGGFDQAHTLKRLVKSEFIFMLRELFHTAQADMKRQLDISLRRLRFVTYSAIFPFVSQLKEAANHYREVVAERPDGAKLPDDNRLKTILERWRADIAAYEKLSGHMKNLKKQCFLIAAG